MTEYPKSQDMLLVVILKDTSANPIAGAVYNAVSVTIVKANRSQADVTITSASWAEITGSAYSSQGYYNLLLTGTYADVTGIFQYSVVYTGSVPYFGVVKIVDGDTGAIYNRIGVPNYGTIANDIANVGVTAGSGGFTSADRAMISATYHTTSFLPTDPASMSGVLTIVTQSFWTGDRQNLTAIKAKTDNLPATPASQGDVTTSTTNVNAHTDADFNQIKGGSWNSNMTLFNIWTYASYTWMSGATSASISNSLSYTLGAGFVPGTDDLHNLSLQIQGITPGSGGGGFSTADRTALNSIYSSTLPLPSDPASNSYLSGVIHSGVFQVMGAGPFGAGTGTTVYQVAQDTANIRAHTNFIQQTSQVATTVEVNAARDYLAGTGYVQASDSLHIISTNINLLTFSSSFTSGDRAMISSTLLSQSIILNQEQSTYNQVTLVKNKTDNLPSDPVSTAHIDPILNQILSASAVSGGFSDTDRTNIVAIKAKTDNLPAQPADQAITFGTSDRNQLQAIYSKTSNLPVDPVSTTYVTLVSQSLSTQLVNLSSSMSASTSGVLGRLGIPAAGSVSADIAAVQSTANSTYAQAASANTNAANAAALAGNAVGAATNAYNETLYISGVLGTPITTIAGDISATFSATLNISASISGVNVDLTPVISLIGQPVKTLARDIYETAKLVREAQVVLSKL